MLTVNRPSQRPQSPSFSSPGNLEPGSGVPPRAKYHNASSEYDNVMAKDRCRLDELWRPREAEEGPSFSGPSSPSLANHTFDLPRYGEDVRSLVKRLREASEEIRSGFLRDKNKKESPPNRLSYGMGLGSPLRPLPSLPSLPSLLSLPSPSGRSAWESRGRELSSALELSPVRKAPSSLASPSASASPSPSRSYRWTSALLRGVDSLIVERASGGGLGERAKLREDSPSSAWYAKSSTSNGPLRCSDFVCQPHTAGVCPPPEFTDRPSRARKNHRLLRPPELLVTETATTALAGAHERLRHYPRRLLGKPRLAL